ncbi:hypothetical protein [Mesorhizobium sp. M1409]|uniref:hypothetical protein n=1 Tax=unclassified Mesorhizobium TaxID=325217 RepID=UPI003337EFC3
MIGIALQEFGDHFVIAAPNALSEQLQEKRETVFRPELRQTTKASAIARQPAPYGDRGSIHEADFLF